jgi:hypothetical protein
MIENLVCSVVAGPSDRPRLTQWTSRSAPSWDVFNFCTMDRPGFGLRPPADLTRVPVCLCGPSDRGRQTIRRRQNGLDRDCVFLVDCTTDCPRKIGNPRCLLLSGRTELLQGSGSLHGWFGRIGFKPVLASRRKCS